MCTWHLVLTFKPKWTTLMEVAEAMEARATVRGLATQNTDSTHSGMGGNEQMTTSVLVGLIVVIMILEWQFTKLTQRMRNLEIKTGIDPGYATLSGCWPHTAVLSGFAPSLASAFSLVY